MGQPDFQEESVLWRQGYRLVAGLDEVGRGAWAGPIVAAAVIFPVDGLPVKESPLRIRDSKQLLPHQREILSEFIRRHCLAFSLSAINVKVIDREGIVKANQRAFRDCLRQIKPQPDFVLIDAFHVKYLAKKKQKPIIKGDQKSLSIAAASIVAKVYRDSLMKKLHQADERYGFDRHKGYGTVEHQNRIRQYGLGQQHRRSFVPARWLPNSSKS